VMMPTPTARLFHHTSRNRPGKHNDHKQATNLSHPLLPF
jgi:hypothetical protein